MDIIYAQEDFPTTVTKTLFLAGPTPRDGRPSWRVEALSILEELGYDGIVFLPEGREGFNGNVPSQIVWEEEALNRADVIVFWVPRDMDKLPGLTTNIEWGRWEDSGKVIWGAPEEAEHVRYPIHYAKKLRVPGTTDLRQALKWATESFIGEGALRVKGECTIPLHIWRRKDFQEWYQAQVKVGNRLESGRVTSSFHATKSGALFSYTIHVRVWIAKERRSKINEFCFFRPDIASVLMYHGDEVVLVREFRSPVRNSEGFVYELPSGSSSNPKVGPQEMASDEVFEEVGLRLSPARFIKHEARQLYATLTTHTSTLFSVELTEAELAMLKEDHRVHGLLEESERTYIEVRGILEILSKQLVDWSTLGMILSVLSPKISHA